MGSTLPELWDAPLRPGRGLTAETQPGQSIEGKEIGLDFARESDRCACSSAIGVAAVGYHGREWKCSDSGHCELHHELLLLRGVPMSGLLPGPGQLRASPEAVTGRWPQELLRKRDGQQHGGHRQGADIKPDPDLSGAKLVKADLSGADVRGADDG